MELLMGGIALFAMGVYLFGIVTAVTLALGVPFLLYKRHQAMKAEVAIGAVLTKQTLWRFFVISAMAGMVLGIPYLWVRFRDSSAATPIGELIRFIVGPH